MSKIVFVNDNGEEIIIRENLDNNYDYAWQVLFREDYIAMKCWSREDVAIVLKDNGFNGTPEEVDKVLNFSNIKALGDCTDSDWSIIEWAISDAEDEGLIHHPDEDV